MTDIQLFQPEQIHNLIYTIRGKQVMLNKDLAKINEKDGFYLVHDGEIALILEKMNKNIIKSVIAQNPRKVITLDRLFKNNDQLKTNTALQMKDAEIELKTI